MSAQLFFYLRPFEALVAVPVFLETGFQNSEELLAVCWRKLLFVTLNTLLFHGESKISVPELSGQDFMQTSILRKAGHTEPSLTGGMVDGHLAVWLEKRETVGLIGGGDCDGSGLGQVHAGNLVDSTGVHLQQNQLQAGEE